MIRAKRLLTTTSVLLSALLFSACVTPKFNRSAPNSYTNTVCNQMVESIYRKDKFTDITQVVVAKERDACTKRLILKLRSNGISVVPPSATLAMSSAGEQVEPLPRVSFYSNDLGENIVVAALVITRDKTTTTYNQTFTVAFNPNDPNRQFQVTPIGVEAVGAL